MDWSLVDEHDRRDITIYTIGFGNADRQLMSEMAFRTGGRYYHCQSPDDLDEVFEQIFEKIKQKDQRAVEPPSEEAMVKEVLPPYLEYIDGTASRELDERREGNNGETILKWKKEGPLNIDEDWDISYKVRATGYGHDLPLTVYDEQDNPRSRIAFLNITSGEREMVYTPGPTISVHGFPEPVIGGSEWHGVTVEQPIIFKNRTNEEKTTWPGDCKPETYRWETPDGEVYLGSGDVGEANKPHRFSSPGRYDIRLTAITECNVTATTVKPITVAGEAPPPPPPPPPPSSPPPPGMGIANPTPTPVQVGVGNPMATPTPTGVPQPTATPQMTMQPMATSQPMGMPTTTAIFSGFMPVAAQKNPAEKIKMSVKNLN